MTITFIIKKHLQGHFIGWIKKKVKGDKLSVIALTHTEVIEGLEKEYMNKTETALRNPSPLKRVQCLVKEAVQYQRKYN